MQTPRRPLPFLRVVGTALIAACAALSAAAQAYPPTPTPPDKPFPPNLAEPITPPPPTVSDEVTTRSNGLPARSTETVISKISQLTSEQLRISQIAAARATNAQVRTFAEELQDSSQDLQQEIDRLAQSKSILVPTGKNSSEMAEEEREWQGKSRRDLDNDYVERVTKLHRDAIDALEDYADDKDMDPEIVTFANKHLPAMREHLRRAESLKKRVD